MAALVLAVLPPDAAAPCTGGGGKSAADPAAHQAARRKRAARCRGGAGRQRRSAGQNAVVDVAARSQRAASPATAAPRLRRARALAVERREQRHAGAYETPTEPTAAVATAAASSSAGEQRPVWSASRARSQARAQNPSPDRPRPKVRRLPPPIEDSAAASAWLRIRRFAGGCGGGACRLAGLRPVPALVQAEPAADPAEPMRSARADQPRPHALPKHKSTSRPWRPIAPRRPCIQWCGCSSTSAAWSWLGRHADAIAHYREYLARTESDGDSELRQKARQYLQETEVEQSLAPSSPRRSTSLPRAPTPIASRSARADYQEVVVLDSGRWGLR